MYRALKPRYEPTGEVTQRQDGGVIAWERVAEWKDLGLVESLDEAKRRFGGSPVLEHISNVH